MIHNMKSSLFNEPISSAFVHITIRFKTLIIEYPRKPFHGRISKPPSLFSRFINASQRAFCGLWSIKTLLLKSAPRNFLKSLSSESRRSFSNERKFLAANKTAEVVWNPLRGRSYSPGIANGWRYFMRPETRRLARSEYFKTPYNLCARFSRKERLPGRRAELFVDKERREEGCMGKGKEPAELCRSSYKRTENQKSRRIHSLGWSNSFCIVGCRKEKKVLGEKKQWRKWIVDTRAF